MKQVLQNMKNGETQVVEVPCPSVRRGTALIQTMASLVSAGTERMLVEFAEKSLVGKARSRPDLVRQVVDKARREGIVPSMEQAFNKLDQPMVLGYSSAGIILEAGEGLKGFKPGDRVACAGGGYAVHSEMAIVPQNMLTHLPDNVDFESAAFTTLGAIALQGFRLANVQVGSNVCVIGLGLLGLLTVGIARAAGCRVFGVDLDPARVKLAEAFGATAVLRADAEAEGKTFSRGKGFDAVLICADASSNDPVELAGVLARDKGDVVAVGAVGLNIPRKVYYEKELRFQVSRSYGPGRYDPLYEEGGYDYPLGQVRWTEGRNLESFVDLLASGKLDVHPLISHRFPIDVAGEAYDLITGKKQEPFLGVLLTYPDSPNEPPVSKRVIFHTQAAPVTGKIRIGVLGAGNYASAVFLPAIKKVGGVTLVGIGSSSGLSARHAGGQYGFSYATSDETQILDDPSIQLVVVLTRHNSHARQIQAALTAGKAVYCEKPLAISEEQLTGIERLLETPELPLLTVGFNRRFAPFAQKLLGFLGNSSQPMYIHYRINAGFIPLTHWLHDPLVGGGRIIGEACHFIDFLTYLTGQVPIGVTATALPDGGIYRQDNVTMTFDYPDGSIGTVTYLANGDKSFPKERVEVFCGGKVAVLDDFRSLSLTNAGRTTRHQSRLSQDKGHAHAWQAFLQAVQSGGEPTIPYHQLLGVTRATLAVMESLRDGSRKAIG